MHLKNVRPGVRCQKAPPPLLLWVRDLSTIAKPIWPIVILTCSHDRAHLVLGHLPDQGPPWPVAQFGRGPVQGQVSVVPDFFSPYPNYRDHCALGNFQRSRKSFIPFPRYNVNSPGGYLISLVVHWSYGLGVDAVKEPFGSRNGAPVPHTMR
jgi:hypothetical protein